MNQNRQPEGIPTGGQYATTPKSDADVALEPRAESRPRRGLERAHQVLDSHYDRMLCAEILEQAAEWDEDETAIDACAYIVFEKATDEGEAGYDAYCYDAAGHRLDGAIDGFPVTGGRFRSNEVPTEFQPDWDRSGSDATPVGDLRAAEPWQHRLTLDVAKLRGHDFDADAARTQAAVFDASHADLDSRREITSFVVDRDVIAEDIGPNGGEDLTEERRAQVMDAVMADPRLEEALQPAYDRYNYLVGVHVQEALDAQEYDDE